MRSNALSDSNRVEHHHHRSHRAKLRQRHAQHHPEMSRPLDPGRVERLLGHVADPGEIEDHRQPGERPAADDRQRVNRDAIVAEPFAHQKTQTQCAQHAVERPEDRVENEEEHEAHGDQRHRHRKEDRRAQHGWEINRANTHRVGDEKSEYDGEGKRHHQPSQIVFERDIEILVTEHVGVIGEPDELLGRRHSVPFKETQINRVNDRISDKAGKERDRQEQSEQRDEDMMAGEGDEGGPFVAHSRSHWRPPRRQFSDDLKTAGARFVKRHGPPAPPTTDGSGLFGSKREPFGSRFQRAIGIQGPGGDQVLILPRTRSASVSVSCMASSGDIAPASTP